MGDKSSVGDSRVYEAGDQRNLSKDEKKEAEEGKFRDQKENSHMPNDSKDERTIANKLERESKREKEEEEEKSLQAKQIKEDPTLPATSKGNKPSKGAKIDAQIQAEEEEELRRKGKLDE